MERDVRTLLFCKISPTTSSNSGQIKSHTDIYSDICKVNDEVVPRQNDKHTYFAFGGFDALITYKPDLSDGVDWLRDIYKDKQNIIRSNSPNIVYHQMHLVTQHNGNNAFWEAEDEEYPFFLATLVYGVQRPASVKLTAGESSTYEHVVRQYIETQKKRECEFCYAVYNGIGISDVVILWRAKDIGSIMDTISQIEYSGTARKTLTTLSFPMSDDGVIKDCVFRSLKSQTVIGDDDLLRLSIHGSIKNRVLFKDLYLEMSEGKVGSYLQDPKTAIRVLRDTSQQSLSLGKNDFIISAYVDGPSIAKLVEFYFARHSYLSEACWEILTDFRKKDDGNEIDANPSSVPSDILSNVYNEFLDKCDQLHEYSWCNAMLELLGTHYYIDHHPVLHGPSYLIYDSLKIANEYFFGKVQDFKNPDILKKMLIDSEDRIQDYIHNLDQLTEQITRNDDAMLNNRSNSHSIHFSLPESALDFYHAFLRRIVDFLVEYDQRMGRKPKDFEYDFLLSPKVSTRFRFSRVFKTWYTYRSEEEKSNRMIWPRKQAYILELPIVHVFSPLDFFVPAVHECFHCFGDALRLRKKRRQYMALCLSTVIITAAGCCDEGYEEICTILAEMVYFGPNLEKKDSANNYFDGAYLDIVQAEFQRNIFCSLGMDGLERLFELSGKKYHQLYSDSVIDFWNKAQSNFFDSRAQRHLKPGSEANEVIVMDKVIKQCKTYFKECYADAMTIALLKLTPVEYLERIVPEANLHYEKMQPSAMVDVNLPQVVRANADTAIIAQRIAIVMSACCKQNHVDTFSEKQCKDVLHIMKSDKYEKLAEMIEKCFDAIYYDDKKMPGGKSYLPSAALAYVVSYLSDAIDLMYDNAPVLTVHTKDGNESYSHQKLVEDFEQIIRRGDMFGKRFYELIYQHHDNILRKLDKTNA